MIKIKLKAIIYQADFRNADKTLFLDFKASSKYPGDLGPNECFLFVAGKENQLIWWLRTVTVDVLGVQTEATHAYRTRLDRHSYWNPMMLADYAKAVGIDLEGIRSFKKAFTEQRNYVKRLRAEQRAEAAE